MKHCPACNAEIANDLQNCGRHGVSTDEPLPQPEEKAEHTGIPRGVVSDRDTRNLSTQQKLDLARKEADAERLKAEGHNVQR